MEWGGLVIELALSEPWRSYREVYGYALIQLEIRAPGPLPIAETGYHSRYESADNIEAEGGPVAYVRAWLDEAAQRPEWQAAQQERRQLSLF